MSTLWLARRCSFVHSAENHPDWYRKVSDMLRREGHDHVRYTFRAGPAFSDVSDYEDDFFDFALVDGSVDRARCTFAVIPKIKKGGWIYLDNTDLDAQLIPDGDLARAEARILDEVERRGGSFKRYVDFSPGAFVVTEGLLAHL